MSSTEFAQFALQDYVAPPSMGPVKARLRHATRVMLKFEREQRERNLHRRSRARQWTANRVKDCWYADRRITPNAEEIRDLEEITGLEYGRQELRSLDQLICQADALLEGPHEDFFRPFVDAFRAMARALDRTRAGG